MKSRCLPDLLLEFLERWKTQLPDYSIFFHDDDAVDKLLYQDWSESPHLHETLQCVQKGAMKIDIWRQLVVYKYGGLYTDIDVYPTTNWDDQVIAPNVSAWSVSDIQKRQSQWLFAMEPRHPIAYFTVLYGLEHVFNLGNIQKPPVVSTTGPDVMSEAYRRFGHHEKHTYGRTVSTWACTARSCARWAAVKTWWQRRGTASTNGSTRIRSTPSKNVTGREKVTILTGVAHWQKTKKRSVEHNSTVAFSGRCRDYIVALEKDKSIPHGFV